MKPAALSGLAAVIVLAAPGARAATALHTTASARQAEVGDGIRIEMSALSDGDDSPDNPRLRAPPGFSVQGPSVASSQQISFTNGHFEHRRGITATWIVTGTRPGRFVIGPVSVDVGKSVAVGERIDVEIVEKGAIPRAPQGRRRSLFDPGNPFDPFSMLQHLPNMPSLDDLAEAPLDAPPDAPSDYIVAHAPQPLAFLRATVTPKQAVVGEQVTLSVYAYAGAGPYDEMDSSEPSRADFLSQSIIDSSFKQPRYIVPIDGTRWIAVKLRQIALFPLRAGPLPIGSMRLSFRGPGYPDTPPSGGLPRESPQLMVTAVEPPIAGRPPGYELGDVGTYTLSADVEPRKVEVGDAVAVTIRIEGTGNVPHHVKIPEQNGVDWLDPTITEGVTPNETTVGGYRQFRYVVRLEEPGTLDLGEVMLPYYDAHLRRYEVARAHLGKVEVSPGKPAQTIAAPAPTPSGNASAAGAPVARDPFAGLGPIRKTASASSVPPQHLSDKPVFWAFLFGAPGMVAFLRSLLLVSRRLLLRRKERSSSGAARVGYALSDARAAAAKRDAAAVASAVERAVYTAIEDRLGLRARAVLRASLSAELERRGADPDLAVAIGALLGECETMRFAAPTGADLEPLVERGAAVVSQLGRVGRLARSPEGRA